MCRPLKDIVAELEAKYEGEELIYTLEERMLIIGSYGLNMEYLLMMMENYEYEVRHVLDHKLSVAIISRITQNLLLYIAEAHNTLSLYSLVLTDYLMDERYDENYKYLQNYESIKRKIDTLISSLKENNIFVIDNIDEDGLFFDKLLKHGFGGDIPPLVISEKRIAYKNGNDLLTCLEYELGLFLHELTNLKMISYLRDDDLMEDVFERNYLLYAKKYWPVEHNNFRPHIERQRLRGNISISGLEKLRDDAMHEFEYHTEAGKIWRDFSEDKVQMAIQMKEKRFDEEQWKYFFSELFKFDEYDRWIDELKNPQIQQVSESSSKSSVTRSSNDINKIIVGFFTDGLLNVDKPSLLYFLLLAMWARRLLQNKEIPAFVRMVGETYPSLFDTERTQERVIMSLQNMNGKANKYFDDTIKDQASMIEYIDLMYPKKKNGKRRKECERAVNLATDLFLKLK